MKLPSSFASRLRNAVRGHRDVQNRSPSTIVKCAECWWEIIYLCSTISSQRDTARRCVLMVPQSLIPLSRTGRIPWTATQRILLERRSITLYNEQFVEGVTVARGGRTVVRHY
ncbi:hypothetical protein PMAYCL1PPCAC_13964 [Pristionchus mayeri]|uniref:Uncharacterized protein n=1 Tax=Pristionchus mayeri TaxID=1317129 RepID=A0AAN4ZQX9_9BILA|nr:hypothetical protein PMAYCL1PPCAC_13964 [Pristionchus mayeri]